MSIKSVLVGVLALCAVAGSAAAAGNELRVGIEGAYPPFSEVSQKGELIGYDVDIAHAICSQMNLECVLVKTGWDDLIPSLQADKIDVIIASMSITDERKKLVDFTDSYYKNKIQFIAAKNASFDQSNLAGQKLGTQVGTIAASWLEANAKGATVKLYPNQDAVFAALASGEISAVLADNFAIWQWMMTPAGKNYELKGKPVMDNDKIAMAVKKGNSELVKKLNAALAEIINNGEYQLINDRYFPFDIN